MGTSIRVFAVLADSQLRQQVQKQWRANGISLCGIHAECTESLVEEVARLRPDVVIADAEVDDISNFVQVAARRFRVPVIAVVRGTRNTLAALRPLEWGAVSLVARTAQSIDSMVAELGAAVHSVREAQVVELLESVFPLSGAFPNAAVFDMRRALRNLCSRDKIVVVGAGVGGPMAVRRILQKATRGECSPMIYVQRISDALVPSLVQWLEMHTGVKVQRATNGEALEVGMVYVVGACEETKVDRVGERTILRVSPPNGNGKPMDALLASVAQTYGERAVGVLLSGHGDDGCAGMMVMRDAGALTIAQDRASSLVYELPGRVRECGGAIECLPINEIAERILMLMPSGKVARV
jgi:two-component system chemotaxis response regulator CheB